MAERTHREFTYGTPHFRHLQGATAHCNNRAPAFRSAKRKDAPLATTREQPMPVAANILIALVALLHLYFLVLEMFLWTRPIGRRAFGLSADFATQSRVLAANQGLYNGFLAAGLIWGLGLGSDGFDVKVFFLGCVLLAGIFGGLTASRKILWLQAMPAAIGLTLVLLA